jgi:hypothetical protein
VIGVADTEKVGVSIDIEILQQELGSLHLRLLVARSERSDLLQRVAMLADAVQRLNESNAKLTAENDRLKLEPR